MIRKIKVKSAPVTPASVFAFFKQNLSARTIVFLHKLFYNNSGDPIDDVMYRYAKNFKLYSPRGSWRIPRRKRCDYK